MNPLNEGERSTASALRDLSAPGRASGAPPSQRVPGWLKKARKMGPLRRTEPCVCDTDITAEVGWEAAAVDEHNLSDAHRKWREWRVTQGWPA
jgi:hypothetical protein